MFLIFQRAKKYFETKLYFVLFHAKASKRFKNFKGLYKQGYIDAVNFLKKLRISLNFIAIRLSSFRN